MQYSVPQFTEVEDRLIGSLTLKQFLVLLAAGGVILFFWSILGPSIPFFILSFPIALLGIGAALGKYNGRPAFSYLMPFVAFVASQRTRVFKREAGMMMVSKAQVQAPIASTTARKEELPEVMTPESTESRLKKLAYLLDSKEKQQEDIIGGDASGVIQAPNPKAQIDLSGFIKKAKSEVQSFAQTGVLKHTRSAENTSVTSAPAKTRKSASKQDSKPAPRKFDPSSFLQN